LKQRKHLPFGIGAEDSDTGNQYTLDQAFRLRLMLDLLGVEGDEASAVAGLTPAYAKIVVDNAMHLFPRHPLNQIEPLDWFLGVVVFDEPQPGGGKRRFSEPLACEVQQLSAWLAERCKPEKNKGRRRLVRLFLVNVTQAARSGSSRRDRDEPRRDLR
jgi:hypothetical protein